MHRNSSTWPQPTSLPNAQPQWDLSVYDPSVRRNPPSASTISRKAAVALEDTIRFGIFESGAFFSSVGNLITQKAGTQNNLRFDAHELKGTQRSLFTHNHPDGFSFSLYDVEIAVDLDLIELRAVTSYCRFILQPIGNWPSWSMIESAFRRHTPSACLEVSMMVHASQLRNIDIDKEIRHRTWHLVSSELRLKYIREVS